MYTFVCNAVTLKSQNRVGDLVGLVIKDTQNNQTLISLEEAEELVLRKEIEGLKLEPYKIFNTNNEEVGKGSIILFEDGRPIMSDELAWYKDLAKSKDIRFSEKAIEAIDNLHYK